MVEKDQTITIKEDISFVPKLTVLPKYLKAMDKQIWVNNFLVNFKKDLYFQEFAVIFNPELGRDNAILKQKIFSKVKLGFKQSKFSIFTGDAFFLKTDLDTNYETIYSFEVKANNQDYVITLQNTTKKFNLIKSNTSSSAVQKMLYELVINKIIKNNPNVEIYRRLFVNINEKKELYSERNNLSVDFYPGFQTSINILKEGIFLNVGLRNRFLSKQTCYEIIKSLPNDKVDISNKFKERSVKTTYSKKNYVVTDIAFDLTPKKTINYNGEEVSLITFYKKAHGVTIKNTDQFLFESVVKDKEGKPMVIHLIPELCLLSGLDDKMISDRSFMQELAAVTKFEPAVRVENTKKFFNLMFEKKEKKIDEKTSEPSSFKLCEELGVSISNTESTIKGYMMDEPVIFSGKVNLKDKLDRQKVHKNVISTANPVIVCYFSKDYDYAAELEKLLGIAGKEYGITPPSIEWCELSSTKKEDWIASINQYKMENYSMVIFVLDSRKEFLYNSLKRHSLVEKGYLSQVVKTENIKGKRNLSVASKLLVQMNNKLGGVSYFLNDSVLNEDLMLISIDSSHISGRRTGVAMVASINNDFTLSTSQIDIIEEKNKTQLCFCVGKFINKALIEYFKIAKKFPKGIVVYRQGVSQEQKEYIKQEVAVLENYCNGFYSDCVNKNLPIPYYFVFVNKKMTYKFFEKRQKNFENPGSGLIIFDGATNSDRYEFFIQPQKVTQGSATPTHYNFAFTNDTGKSLDKIKDLIPKLSYHLCYLYPNWPGAVRVPYTLKLAEKLSKIVSKNIKGELHQNLKNTQCYL